MSDNHDAGRIRDHFLGWQCRIREHAMRHHGGRPSPGMRPRVRRPDGTEIAAAVTMVLVEAKPDKSTALFRHIVHMTHDPERRYREALKVLASAYFRHPEHFSDVITALFALDSPLAATLTAEGRCVLAFDQDAQSFRIPCAVAALAPDHPAYLATYWHNHMFNPGLPGAVHILAFTPDWPAATASPSA